MAHADAFPPPRELALADGGSVTVRTSGPLGASPPLVLLHGWTVTADLNWGASYARLAEHHPIVAFDLRGHGRGRRQPFSLEACADDVVAVADALGIEAVVPVGYSMGGLVAQLVWQRHRARVAGLVLAATARNFRGSPMDRAFFNGVTGLASLWRLAPGSRRDQALERLIALRTSTLDEWAAAEVRAGDPRAFLDAGAAIGRFSSHSWIGEVDVPTAVLVNTADVTVPAARQHRLAAAVPRARCFEIDGDHHVCVARPERFVPVLLEACRHVTEPGGAPGLAGGARTA
ncbi:MAG: alpha/beta hydrolase [Acidimicrobiia bacterium]|nr:alpha/beta hydrolase [Acidimicrobiia bacterium]